MEPTTRQAKVLIQINDAEGEHPVGSTMTFDVTTPSQAAGFERLMAQGVIEPVSPRSRRTKAT